MPESFSFQFTRNFTANLALIEAFFERVNAGQAYLALLDQLEQTVIPNLVRFPSIGRPFMQRQQRSLEVCLQIPTLQGKLAELGMGSELREFLTKDYLILYTFNERHGYLLSIKHHRQVSFDFSALWERNDYPLDEVHQGKLLLQQNSSSYF
jgi:hypothetical protein